MINRWHPLAKLSLSPLEKRWLRLGGALTQHIKHYGEVGVVVLNEHIRRVTGDECQALGIHQKELCWVREVALTLDQQVMIVARSITPYPSSRTVWKAIRQLGNRPLASLLYHDKTIHRSAFESRQLHRTDELYRYAQQHSSSSLAERFLIRRSVFVKSRQRLIVAECFLPQFWTLLAEDKKVTRLT